MAERLKSKTERLGLPPEMADSTDDDTADRLRRLDSQSLYVKSSLKSRLQSAGLRTPSLDSEGSFHVRDRRHSDDVSDGSFRDREQPSMGDLRRQGNVKLAKHEVANRINRLRRSSDT
jgi:hypothetical protein